MLFKLARSLKNLKKISINYSFFKISFFLYFFQICVAQIVKKQSSIMSTSSKLKKTRITVFFIIFLKILGVQIFFRSHPSPPLHEKLDITVFLESFLEILASKNSSRVIQHIHFFQNLKNTRQIKFFLEIF